MLQREMVESASSIVSESEVFAPIMQDEEQSRRYPRVSTVASTVALLRQLEQFTRSTTAIFQDILDCADVSQSRIMSLEGRVRSAEQAVGFLEEDLKTFSPAQDSLNFVIEHGSELPDKPVELPMTAWPSLYDEDRSVPAWAQGIQGRLDGCRQEPQVENQEAYSDPQFFKREWEREIAKEEMELQTARKQHHKEAKEMMKKQKENERSKVAANVQEIKKKRFVVMDDCRDLIRTQTGLPVMATKHKDIKYEVDAAASQNLCNLSIFNVNPSLASSYARSEQKMILPAQVMMLFYQIRMSKF
uniref:Uncharacterized protein n=2 Tax=Guillardia theta TaxID=55529 RepID=A0A7S4PE42_GUITH|mmetsp:Transcript_4901/g.17776  ORF Transcript_4901/g.17776 Transcript_4901/m.17776 type:complete len:302 (+) Transcript_4901:242-1147(+)